MPETGSLPVRQDEGMQAESVPAAVVPECTFNGNPLLKRENVSVGLTSWHLDEMQKCMLDPIYFAENYMKVVHVDRGLVPLKLYDYQKKMLKAMSEHRYSIILSCRQSGKCVCGKTKVKASHPKVNGGEPFETSAENLFRLAKNLRLKG